MIIGCSLFIFGRPLAFFIVWRYRVGIAKQNTAPGRSNPEATLPDAGKSKNLTLKQAGLSTSAANRFEKIADIPEEEFEKVIDEARKKQTDYHFGYR